MVFTKIRQTISVGRFITRERERDKERDKERGRESRIKKKKERINKIK